MLFCRVNPQILTLFGEVYEPQPKPAAKTRAKRKPAQDTESPKASGGEASDSTLNTPPKEPLPAVPPALFESAPQPETTVQNTEASLSEISQPILSTETIANDPAVEYSTSLAAQSPAPPAEDGPVIGSAVKSFFEIPAAAPPEIKPAEEKAPTASATVKKRAKKKPSKKRIIVHNENILKGWVAVKQYYAIGEVAALFQVNTSHIRFWTNEFALKVRTTRKGDRLYTPDQIRELKTIYHLVKGLGYTLAGAKAKLREDKKDANQKARMKQSLLKLRQQLVHLQKNLA